MSGIYIPGMEMPIACAPCKVRGMCGLWKQVTLPAHLRHPECPLIPVPDHGDLIDAQEQMRLMQSSDYDTYDDYNRAFDMLDCAPTIIPADSADKEGEG